MLRRIILAASVFLCVFLFGATARAEVVCDMQSGLYYKPDCAFLPLSEFQEILPDEQTAFRQGYKKSPRSFLEDEHRMEVQLSAYWDQYLRDNLSLYARNHPLTKRVHAVADRILPVVTRNYVPLKAYVAPGKGLLSFTVLGGGLVLTDKLVDACATDDELAAVLAHELAHFDREDLLGAIGEAKGMDLFLSVAMDHKFTAQELRHILEATLATAAKGYDADTEVRADVLAMVYMSQAGFPPESYLAAMDRLGRAGASRIFLSRFTNMTAKINALAKLLPDLRHKGDVPAGKPLASPEYTVDAEALRGRALQALGRNDVRLRVFECLGDKLPYRGLYVQIEDLMGEFGGADAQEKLTSALRSAYLPTYPRFSYVKLELTRSWKKEGFHASSFALD